MRDMRALAGRLKTWLWPDPAHASLSWWLVTIELLLVLLVAGGISWTASRMLRGLADEHGKARVQLAASLAREELHRIGADARAAAQALGERPTLQRLLAQSASDALPPVLRRACDASGMDGCAVMSGKSVIVTSLPALDWAALVTAADEQGATFLVLPATERVPLLGARASVGSEGQAVYVMRRLDARLAHGLSTETGLEIQLVDYRTYTSGTVGAFTPLYAAALADGHSAVQRIDSADRVRASRSSSRRTTYTACS